MKSILFLYSFPHRRNSTHASYIFFFSYSTQTILVLAHLLFSLIISKQFFNSSKLLCVFYSLRFYQNNCSTHPSFWAFSFLSAYTQTIARFILILYRFLFSPIPPKQLFNSTKLTHPISRGISGYAQTVVQFILVPEHFLFSPITPKQLFNSS